jgi:pyruvate-ferredoxin/flavodoxin oxidoreductase
MEGLQILAAGGAGGLHRLHAVRGVCPVKSKTDPKQKAINMKPMPPLREQEKVNFEFFLNLPSPDRTRLAMDVKGTQFREPLFEFSGACSGCGETPYVKLLTQLSGDRLIVANATGCSSIFGGNLPTTPYTVNSAGRGPAWSNSLFEDNAEYGFGQRIGFGQANGIRARTDAKTRAATRAWTGG